MALRGAPPLGTSFVGRDGDLEQLRQRFSRGVALVTLAGPGGVGKTRLALRFTQGWTEGDVAFCELAEARDQDAVCDAIARHAPAAVGQADRVEALGAALAGRGRLLIVLDNCEQILADVASALARWLVSAPSVRWLVTSREQLRMRAEEVQDVAPLAPPAAAELFVDRAMQARPACAIGAADAAAVDAIVRRLDGLPLAIELAAARMSVLSAPELLGRIEKGLDAAAGGTRDMAPRHRTMRATAVWSWSLLEPWERAALRRCAVFRGGFTVEAAEQVVDLSAFGARPAVDVVQALRQKSLVRAYRPADAVELVRLGLYESVRDLASEELARDAGEERAARARHARYYLDAGEGWLEAVDAAMGERRAAALRDLSLEHDNLRAVHEWALADAARGRDAMRVMLVLQPVFRTRGSASAHLALLDRTLASAHHVDLRVRARVLLARAHVHRMSARLAAAEVDCSAVLALARDAGDALLEGRAHYALFNIAQSRGHAEDGRPHLEAAARLFEGTSRRWRAAAISQLAGLRAIEGNSDEAYRLYDRAVGEAALHGPDAGEWLLNKDFAVLLMTLGRLDEARPRIERALQIARALGEGDTYAITLGYRAVLHQQSGDLERALSDYEEATSALRDASAFWLQQLLAGMGALLATLGRVGEAERAFDEAERLAHVEPARRALDLQRGHLDLARARACEAAGDEEGAAAHMERARSRCASGEAFEKPGDDLRLTRRLLRHAVEEHRRRARTLLIVGPDTSWFRVSGGKEVDLRRQGRLRRLLDALIRAHAAVPGRPLTIADVIREVWPGERMLARAGKRRIQVAVSTLRGMGLHELLRCEGDGYLLDPDTRVES
jgi:predicted ATPase